MKKHTTFVDDFCDVLVAEKLIASSDAIVIRKAFHDSDADEFDDFLLEQGLISSPNLLHALARYYQVSYFDVKGHFFDRHLLRQFPKDFLLQNGIIPLEDDESTMVMVASNPANTDLLMGIGEYVSYDIQFQVGLRRDITDAIEEHYDKALTEGVEPNLYDEPDVYDQEQAEIEEREQQDEELVRYADDEDIE